MRPATLEPATFSFTLAQLEAITAWATQRPLGLCVRLMSDFDETEEVAEVFRPGGTPPLWPELTKRPSGTHKEMRVRFQMDNGNHL